MRPEVNSKRFENSNRFEILFVYMAIYIKISLRHLSEQEQDPIEHVQMISFN